MNQKYFTTTTSDMQSTATSLFSAYASVAAFMMMFRSLASELLPKPVRSYLKSLLRYFFNPITSSNITVTIEEQAGMTRNEIYDAAETYLSTKINSTTTERFKLSKNPKQKNVQVSLENNEEIKDTFDNNSIHLTWKFVTLESKPGQKEKSLFQLSFDRKFKDRVVEDYVPHVLARAKEIKDSDKAVKLYSTGCLSDDGMCGVRRGMWGSISLDHPSTFKTLAMEPEMKKAIIDDLERFLRRKDYYKKVGKAWKRGYLLYGPPGTGKSSLIAAMANYLKFDVYDLELTSIHSNADLRRLLVSTMNRSIVVIEDIDCSAEMQDRKSFGNYGHKPHSSDSKLTLSGLLNFIDGLWSSCGDERIIVFTTNHKEKLDPALLRPGRMDLHIHMSYCTYQGFRQLASNYLGIDDHYRFSEEIEDLLQTLLVTPAEISEELMKSDDVDIALAGVVKFLKCKKMEASKTKDQEKDVVHDEGDDIHEEELADGSDDYEPHSLATGRTEKRSSRKKTSAKS